MKWNRLWSPSPRVCQNPATKPTMVNLQRSWRGALRALASPCTPGCHEARRGSERSRYRERRSADSAGASEPDAARLERATARREQLTGSGTSRDTGRPCYEKQFSSFVSPPINKSVERTSLVRVYTSFVLRLMCHVRAIDHRPPCPCTGKRRDLCHLIVLTALC